MYYWEVAIEYIMEKGLSLLIEKSLYIYAGNKEIDWIIAIGILHALPPFSEHKKLRSEAPISTMQYTYTRACIESSPHMVCLNVPDLHNPYLSSMMWHDGSHSFWEAYKRQTDALSTR